MSFLTASSSLYVVGAIFIAWSLYSWYQQWKANPNGLPLPPGPKGHPLIDNLLDFPTWKAWLVYDEWTKRYGDIVYFNVLGQPFVILGSSTIAYEIFEKRSSNYSDRPRMPMVYEMMGWDWSFAVMPYGNRWKSHRRLFHEHFQQSAIHKYDSIHLDATRAFLRRLLKAPGDFVHHTRHLFAASILKIAYGVDIQEKDDPLVTTAEIVVGGLAEAGVPGSFFVDLLPSIKYIPNWFPGTQWKRKAAYWKYMGRRFVNEPWEMVKKQTGKREGSAPPSMARALVEKLPDESSPDREAEEDVSRSACAVAFAGATETTASLVQSFFLAMCLYPDVQKKAQAELDMVLGGERLPEFNDRDSLPYISAILKETLRWQVVGPLGLPHMTTKADEYKGYYIPKGAIVIGNSWTILHDPEIYPDPESFYPGRFLTKDGILDPEVLDPGTAAFGFGRRVCPGRFVADNSIFIMIAHVLAVCDIRPGMGRDGKEVEIKPEMTNGVISYPEPFECHISPRSKQALQLVGDSSLMD